MKRIINKLKSIKSELFFNYLEHTKTERHKRALAKIKDKEKLKCVFFATFDSTWKYDSVYQEMLQNEYFDPIILICPIINYGFDNMIKRMNDCKMFFQNKHYKYIKAYNENNGTYVNVEKDLQPDIIFYTNPYKGLIDNRYYIDKFPNTLTCYIPYFYASANGAMFFDMHFHHLLWRYYVENAELKSDYEHKSMRVYGNIVPVGYCVFDGYNNKPHDNSGVKTVIWSPHHGVTAESGYIRNSFLRFHDTFFKLADEFEGKVHFVFRPHPILKNNLYNHPEWGKQKTDEYYKKWETYNYCSLNENGNYIDMFNDSDAMIHDCGSFMTEYLYYNKPAMYTVDKPFSLDDYWKCAVEAEHCYYQGNTEKEIKDFIIQVVIGTIDPKENERIAFAEKYFMPYSNVGSHIVSDIIKSIKGDL